MTHEHWSKFWPTACNVRSDSRHVTSPTMCGKRLRSAFGEATLFDRFYSH